MNKKEKILEAAKRLYYQKGFNETSMDEIAQQADVQKSLVQYHFVTKANLGNEIYGDYSLAQFRVFSEKTEHLKKKYSQSEKLIAYTLKTVEYLCQDEKAFRFYREYFSTAFEHVTARLEELSELTGLFRKVDKKQLHASYIGIQYALRGIIYHYIIGEIELDKKEFEHFLVSMLLSSGVYGELDCDAVLKAVHSINNSIDISFCENFVWA